jgi:cysteinyl-tRNA synthetase
MEYEEARLTEAAAFAQRIREAGRRLIDGPSPDWSGPLRERYLDVLAADFNTPQALAVVADWIRAANREPPDTVGRADLAEMLQLLGLDDLLAARTTEAPAAVQALMAAREQAREARDYAEADRLRDDLAAHGFQVRDGPDGPELLQT